VVHLKYKFYNDTKYHNWGQEFDLIKSISFVKNNGVYIFKGYNYNTKENEEIQIKKNSVDEYYLEIKTIRYLLIAFL